MSETIVYDAQASRRILAISETPAIRAQREYVIGLLAPEPGSSVLDVGCGPGHLARELAAAVAPGGHVCGTDVSEHMLALAAQDARGEVELVRMRGTELPFEDAVFDAAVATQVYEFVDDLPLALAELRRVLRPGGRALILDTDWDSLVWHSSDAERMRRVIDGWCRRVADPRLPRTLSQQLAQANFQLERREVFTIFDTDGGDGSYCAVQIDHLGASAAGVPAAVLAAWASDLRALADAGECFFSLNRYVFLAVKPTR